MNVQLFIPCFVDQLFPQTAFNMVKLLEKAGCTVSYNTNQTCCGQPAFNAGYREESKIVCTKFIKDFAGKDYIVAPSASCVGFVRNYYNTMFTEDSSYRYEVKALQGRIFELSDFLVNVLHHTDFKAELPIEATYHDSCAALRECKLKKEPRVLLDKVAGLKLTEMQDNETCCGFGGTFAVKFDSISSAMADQKVNNALATGAQCIISTDLSCLMHIGSYAEKNGLNIKTMHLADVLASGW
jgi:L-lactate dehydrogenase complex protein LldE